MMHTKDKFTKTATSFELEKCTTKKQKNKQKNLNDTLIQQQSNKGEKHAKIFEFLVCKHFEPNQCLQI